MSRAIIDNLPMTTDLADEQAPSESDLAIIGELTIWHQMPFLSAHRLIQLNCSLWSVWDSNNVKRIAEARRLDDTRDWYFPITVTKWVPRPGETLPPEVSYTWSGVWHSTAHEAAERVRPLPPMSRMRQDWRYASFPISEVIASAGGLLLIKGRSEAKLQVRRRSPRLNKFGASSSSWLGNSDELQPRDWTRLMVCNPMTRECKELPAANSAEMGWESWNLVYRHGVHVHMEVNDEANSYQVILILRNFVAVYKSTTNTWNSRRFSRPWNPQYSPWAYTGTTAYVGGRLYVADVQDYLGVNANAEVDTAPAGAIRLFDVDPEAGRWKLLQEFPLRKFHLPILNPYPESYPFDMTVLHHVVLVVCMGELYAVIPARLHDVFTVGQKQSNFWKAEVHNVCAVGKRSSHQKYVLGDHDELLMREKRMKHMPLVFYVMELQGDGVGVDHAVLRIPATRSIRNCKLKYHMQRGEMYQATDPTVPWCTNWFCCEARGSVIWVSYKDYLLSFDVVTRKSTTQTIHLDGSNDHLSHYSYRPSFHMKP